MCMVVSHRGARTVNLSTYGPAVRLGAANASRRHSLLSSSLLNCRSAFAACMHKAQGFGRL